MLARIGLWIAFLVPLAYGLFVVGVFIAFRFSSQMDPEEWSDWSMPAVIACGVLTAIGYLVHYLRSDTDG